jgi:hypothetical protein
MTSRHRRVADKARYEKIIEKWNVDHPDDQLVFGKDGYAKRAPKSRVNHEKQAAREAARREKAEKRARQCGPRTFCICFDLRALADLSIQADVRARRQCGCHASGGVAIHTSCCSKRNH